MSKHQRPSQLVQDGYKGRMFAQYIKYPPLPNTLTLPRTPTNFFATTGSHRDPPSSNPNRKPLSFLKLSISESIELQDSKARASGRSLAQTPLARMRLERGERTHKGFEEGLRL